MTPIYFFPKGAKNGVWGLTGLKIYLKWLKWTKGQKVLCSDQKTPDFFTNKKFRILPFHTKFVWLHFEVEKTPQKYFVDPFWIPHVLLDVDRACRRMRDVWEKQILSQWGKPTCNSRHYIWYNILSLTKPKHHINIIFDIFIRVESTCKSKIVPLTFWFIGYFWYYYILLYSIIHQYQKSYIAKTCI